MLKNFFKIPGTISTISPEEYDLVCRRIETRLLWLVGDLQTNLGITNQQACDKANAMLSDISRLREGEILYTMGNTHVISKQNGVVRINPC